MAKLLLQLQITWLLCIHALELFAMLCLKGDELQYVAEEISKQQSIHTTARLLSATNSEVKEKKG
jgi:hypothetical protein